MTPTELRLQLLRLGYLPLPLYGKEPPAYGKNNKRKGLSNWPNLRATPNEVLMWDTQWPDARNSGVITAPVPTFDGDITHPEAARAVEDLVRERYEEIGRLLVRFGNPPKFAIPFRTDEPFEKMLVCLKAQDGSLHKIEFLGKGQQVVVDGIHPDTGKPYGWHGGTLIETPREELPSITQAEAQQLVDDAVDLLVRDFGFTRVNGDGTAPSISQRAIAGRGGILSSFDSGGESFFKNVNSYALENLDRWVPDLVGSRAEYQPRTGAYRISSEVLGRNLQEDLSISPKGIKDWGVWDIGDPRKGKRTPIDLVLEFGARQNVKDAALWLCERTGVSAESLGWNRPSGAQQNVPGAPSIVPAQVAEPPPPCSLDQVHGVFHKWFGDQYDLDACDVACAVAASEQLSGDPAWLMMVSGAGTAKTETVQAVDGAGAHVISTITSDGALLSATEAKGSKQKKATATGGLLRKIGERGVLVIKDFTSILSSDRNVRAAVLAAFREIYDGRWVRNVGSDGGQTIEWRGRIVVIAAVTTAWDAAHAAIAAMGDRFVLLRIDSNQGRVLSGRQAIRNTGGEVQMRGELAAAVGGLVTNANTGETEISDAEVEQLVKAADIVTLARTAVERDYAGNVTNAHAPEMPTRFAKQLVQIVRGGVAIGMTRERALALALRCARDSIPPLRLEIMLDVAHHGPTQVNDVSESINKPWMTVKRELSALTMLGILKEKKEQEDHEEEDSKSKTKWRYSLLGSFDRKTLIELSGRKPPSQFKQMLRGRNR
jgi:DNA-binding transcriptional ArsR family regulator